MQTNLNRADAPGVASPAYLDEHVTPELCDEYGHLRAGKVLEWMDVVGVLSASRFCRMPVVTASVDGIELRSLVAVGARIGMTATVAYTGPKSIGVVISMTACDHGDPPHEVLTGYMTFVPVDASGKVAAPPRFTPSSPVELRLHREGMLRREFRERFRNATKEPTPRRAFTDNDLHGDDKPRLPHDSYVHKIEPVRTTDLNFHGTLYGGTLMRWLESAGLMSVRSHLDGAAARFCGLHALSFLRPVERNVFIHISARVAHVSDSTLTALVTVRTEDPMVNASHDSLRAFLTYQPIDPGCPIAALDCQSEEERALFSEVEQRQRLESRLVG